MITPLVKFDLTAFNADLKDRIERSKRGAVEIINQTALDVAFKALRACPKSETEKVRELKGNRARNVKFKSGRMVTFRSSKMKDVIVGRYYNKHEKSVRGFNFDGLPDAINRSIERRTAGRNFLKSRFVKGIDALGKALGRQKPTGEPGKDLRDDFSYGTSARDMIMQKAQAVIFASHKYSTKSGVKEITDKGKAKLDKAAHDGLLAVQNGWRNYANRVLGKSFNKTN